MARKKIRDPGIYKLRACLTFVDGTTYQHEGTLDLFDVGLRTDTGSRKGRFVFPNPDRVLLPGQFVKVRVKGTPNQRRSSFHNAPCNRAPKVLWYLLSAQMTKWKYVPCRLRVGKGING